MTTKTKQVKSKLLSLKQFKDEFCKEIFNCSWKMMRKNNPRYFTPEHMDDLCEQYKDHHTKPLIKEIDKLKKDSLSIPDIRNKLGPISNLITMLEHNRTKKSSEIDKLILAEIEQCKQSIKYLSRK